MERHTVGFGSPVKQQANGDETSRQEGPHDLEDSGLPVDGQRNREEEDDHGCHDSRQAVSNNQGDGPPASDLVTLLVPKVLDLNGQEGVETEEGTPLVSHVAHGRGLHGCHARGTELAGRVEKGVDDVLAPPRAGADVVVDPGLHHEAQRLREATEQQAGGQEHARGDDIPLLSGLDGESARRDRAPGLVELVLLDGTRVLLVAEIEVEDIQPDVGQSPGESCGNVVPARRGGGDSPRCQAQHRKERDWEDIGLDVAFRDKMGEGDGVLDLGQDRGQVHGLGGHYVCERRRIGCECCCWSKGHIGEDMCAIKKHPVEPFLRAATRFIPHDFVRWVGVDGAAECP